MHIKHGVCVASLYFFSLDLLILIYKQNHLNYNLYNYSNIYLF